ncbi:hypothetical protein FG379_003010 [Cryptosporidium bovis]|uniref:uncharacterized protein n=1 Tax=Cryptosporidium bovis TaxID=310047 RepID=UPI00351AAB45|nr:hypothetical protein FG379_003010 [Cryptosporidium bovis]
MRKIYYPFVLMIISLLYPISMEKRRQLMSSSEIISSTETNLSYFYKFISILSSKETVPVKNKCNIALKNLNSLISVVEKGNIPINIVTLLAINGILWHPDPCNNPIEIHKYLELYNAIKSTPLFTDPLLNLKSETIENKSFAISKSTNTSNRTESIPSPSKNVIKKGKIAFNSNVTKYLDSDEIAANKTGSAPKVNVTKVETAPFNDTDSNLEYERQNLGSRKVELEKELQALSNIKPVSSKSNDFKCKLEQIYSERIQ